MIPTACHGKTGKIVRGGKSGLGVLLPSRLLEEEASWALESHLQSSAPVDNHLDADIPRAGGGDRMGILFNATAIFLCELVHPQNVMSCHVKRLSVHHLQACPVPLPRYMFLLAQAGSAMLRRPTAVSSSLTSAQPGPHSRSWAPSSRTSLPSSR